MFKFSTYILLPSNVKSLPLFFQLAPSFHTGPAEGQQSRIKRVSRHKPFWHIKKLNKAVDEPVTGENKEFLKDLLEEKYKGPLKKEIAPFNNSEGVWKPWSRRCGVLGVKIGVQPLWLKNGGKILTTMLHVSDNHVVRVNPRDHYDTSYRGLQDQRPVYTTKAKNGQQTRAELIAMVVVGSESTDPQKFTKDYCGLFTDSGVMPKRHLARFPVTENAILQPGTPLTASHFTVGQWVDVFGRTQERGFQGGMQRWGFKGMPATMGVTKSHRRIGAIGSGRDKGRVWPGQKMPGNVGGMFRWMCGLRVWRINHVDSVLYVTGNGLPGTQNSVVQICDTRIPRHRWEGIQQDGRFEKFGKLVDGPERFPTAATNDSELPDEEWCSLLQRFSDSSVSYT